MHASMYLALKSNNDFFSFYFCLHVGEEFQKSALATLLHFVRVRAALQLHVSLKAHCPIIIIKDYEILCTVILHLEVIMLYDIYIVYKNSYYIKKWTNKALMKSFMFQNISLMGYSFCKCCSDCRTVWSIKLQNFFA